MDIENIRLETVELLKSKVNRASEADPFAKLVDQMIETSSKVSKIMIEKYHEELTESK